MNKQPGKGVSRRRIIKSAVMLTACAGLFLALVGIGGNPREPTRPPIAIPPGADSVTTTSGASYPAGRLRSFFAGSLNRELWEIPIRLPVLDLETVGGGLRPFRMTGGEQTVGVLFQGVDGLSYDFRLVVKDPAPALPGWMRHGAVAALLNDQMAAQLPYGAVVVARLLAAVGIAAPDPVPVVMPDDSSLGTYGTIFAGRVGLFAVHPSERTGGRPGFGGYTRIVNSDSIYADVYRNPESTFDDRHFLRNRMIDLLVGDWDRHSDQWSWGRDGNTWRGIPEDHDWAFPRTDGVVGGMARWVLPHYVGFSDRFPKVGRLVSQADHIDHVVLNRLGRQDFTSVAREVQLALADSVIELAVGALPPPIFELERDRLVTALKARRDQLVGYSLEYYRHLVRKLQVFGFANSADVVEFDMVSDSGSRVRVRSGGADGPVRFERFVDSRDTREVNVYIVEGEDQLVGNRDLPFKVSIMGPPRGRFGRPL